jgi:hypothetical protein
MSTLLGERIAEAVSKKSTDITSFEWKGVKVLDQDGRYKQEEHRLIDMGSAELISCYDHCKKMLFNKDSQNPGRYFVLETIADQKDRCGVELFLRYVREEHDMAKYTLLGTITGFLETNKVVFKDIKPLLKDMFSSIPNEFEKLPLSLLIDGCLDRLGAFNKKHITRTFILKQGVWLTPTESKELLQSVETDPVRDRLEIIRENLGLKDIEKLYINSKGINYTQMRAMLGLKSNKKYTDLTSMQLTTLRNRILFNLEETVKNHITSWEKRMEEIEMVAEHNKIIL